MPCYRVSAAPIIALCAVTLVGSVACSGEPRPANNSAPATSECGLPAVKAAADPSRVPKEFLLDEPEVEVAETFERRRRFIAALNVSGSVQDTFRAFKGALERSRFDLLQEDNEGFEAELYLQKGNEFAVIQIRASNCDDASLVFLNLPQA